MPERRKHFAVERLSKEGQAVVRRGFDNNWTLKYTQEALQGATGEAINTSSLHNFWKWLKVQQRIARSKQTADAAMAMVCADVDGRAAQVINLRLQELLLEKEDLLGDAEILDILEQFKAMQKLAIAHKKTELAEREVAADEVKALAAMKMADAALLSARARIKAMEDKARAVVEKLEKAEKKMESGRSLTQEELKDIREQVFGFVDTSDDAEVAHA